ncbi:immunity 51 family protein [Sporosarcina limicola]|uniref:Tetratricopeptide (TPR) repeat protein n=1 Tax=Sporosarcina limicola TaxID=34101 RepID=A0A927MG31_9BACL|nr:immunity 51 family protein [Sporosarcina limicola]MBE1553973.1 tetratricopeptide (TPR) repeat protein [Sporosarcina limicola]
MKKEQLKELNRWFEQGDHQKIIDEIVALPDTDIDYELTGHLIRAYNNIDDYDKAIRLLLSVQDQGKEDSLWHFRLGYAYYYSGRAWEALQQFEIAYQLNPADKQANNFVQMSKKSLASQMKKEDTPDPVITSSQKYFPSPDAEPLLPFVWVDHADSVSLILNVGSYKNKIFAERADEGFEGNGYDWGSLAAVFIEEIMPELAVQIQFDPEASMFCAYSTDGEALERFALGFKAACEDDTLIRDLFSRAELD